MPWSAEDMSSLSLFIFIFYCALAEKICNIILLTKTYLSDKVGQNFEFYFIKKCEITYF